MFVLLLSTQDSSFDGALAKFILMLQYHGIVQQATKFAPSQHQYGWVN
jgi:hypothetical protein